MGLFELKRRTNKKSTLEFHIDVENITNEEFLRLKTWVKENIPSTERFTPIWNPDNNATAILPHSLAGGGDIEKVTFRFKHEEHAMAFKLII